MLILITSTLPFKSQYAFVVSSKQRMENKQTNKIKYNESHHLQTIINSLMHLQICT